MLTHFSIRHLTLVDRLDLEFSSGMSVVTGETGAGKSIMLGALALALGDRADSSLIAPGMERAEISAGFNLADNGDANAWLTERSLQDSHGQGSHGQDSQDSHKQDSHSQGNTSYCILRRVLSRDGRSRAFVNGSSVTIGELRTLGEMLLDIHSQHEHQSLLKKQTHRRLLDEFGGHTAAVLKLRAAFDEQTGARKTLDALVASDEAQAARIQLLSYQTEELALIAVAPDETRALEIELKRLNNAETTRETLIEALQLCGGDTDGNASVLVGRAIRLLGDADLVADRAGAGGGVGGAGDSAGDNAEDNAEDDAGNGVEVSAEGTAEDTVEDIAEDVESAAIRSAFEMLSSALIQIDEAARDLTTASETLVADPARLRLVEERLSKIYEVARKHRVEPNQLPDLLETLQRELDEITHVDERIQALQATIDSTSATCLELATGITQARQKAAAALRQEVTTHLENLGMEGAVFEVSLAAAPPGRHGADDIEFLISTNPGQPPGALSRIASGGELSRICLAVQVVTARTSQTPTLVFDEVDAGVGGATAEVVGRLLRRLGEDAQVICVTHLPQVAAQGHHHYRVTKHLTKKHQTASPDGASTQVSPLDDTRRVEEIARMLGGVKQTDQSLAHAESMLAGVRRANGSQGKARTYSGHDP